MIHSFDKIAIKNIMIHKMCSEIYVWMPVRLEDMEEKAT